MKINDTEMKARFFAQYWGQKVLIVSADAIAIQFVTAYFFQGHLFEDALLLLKPLSLISNEDAIEVAKIYGWKENSLEFKDRILQFQIDLPCISIDWYSHKHLIQVFDFLRSKSYALPFMQYSVSDLVEMNWIKLTES